ncbi:MAG TPA: energy transducer TonB [Gemmatimonadaceae bacterium]|nr:energy transducer TonB [Gemmatimonadaceae bacterium]
MIQLLRHQSARNGSTASSFVLSVVAHAVIIAGAVAATANPDTAERELPQNSIARFLAPPDRDITQRPQQEVVEYVRIAVPDVATPKIVTDLDARRPMEQLTQLTEPAPRDAEAAPKLVGNDSIYSVVQVDSVATRYEWSAAPAYPVHMLEQNTEGVVRAEFVVSQEGYVDTATLRVLESTHPDFTKSVRDALPYMRFKPAKIGAAVVSQLVSQEFFFKIAAIADTTRKP